MKSDFILNATHGDSANAPSRPNLLAFARHHFETAADALGLSESMRRMLREIKRELIVHFPMQFDDGSVRVLDGFRVQHNVARGPAKGGLRYHPGMTIDDARALAMSMTWKAAIVNLPFGGAKGGVICDPKQLSLTELERLTRRFTTEISLLIGADRDIPAPDLGTGPEVMGWMMDTLSMHAGYSLLASVTGKPVEIGGSQGRYAATGHGLATVTQQAMRDHCLDATGTVAVQGFGQVGSIVAGLLADADLRVIAVSDTSGGTHNQRGLDIKRLQRHKREGGRLIDAPGGDAITNAELLALDVDVLVLAALESQVHSGNAAAVRARLVAEGSNGPVDPDADDILNAEGIVVVPDIVASAGGVVVSYFEWVQGLQAFFWSADKVDDRLDEVMLRAYQQVRDRAMALGLPLRKAAYQLAVDQVAKAVAVRGIYP